MPSSDTDCELTEQEACDVRIAELARQIKDEKQLRKILLTAQIGLRKGVYLQILPHLSFKPREYRKLMRHAH